jgi:hypothetical protein
VHRLWLNFRRDPGLQKLHHTDIVTYALTRLASEYARDKVETLKELRRYTQGDHREDNLIGHMPQGPTGPGSSYAIPAPKPEGDIPDDIEDR